MGCGRPLPVSSGNQPRGETQVSKIEADLTTMDEVLGMWREGRIRPTTAHALGQDLFGTAALKGASGLAEVRQLGAVQAPSEPTNVETFAAEAKEGKKRTRAVKKARGSRPAGTGPEMKPVREWLRANGHEDLINKKSGYVSVEGQRLAAEAGVKV